jgi:hypothetical protein
VLAHLGVFHFGSDEDRNVRVGVFPEREEILIGRLAFGGVALQCAGSADLQSETGESFLTEKIEVGVTAGASVHDG